MDKIECLKLCRKMYSDLRSMNVSHYDAFELVVKYAFTAGASSVASNDASKKDAEEALAINSNFKGD